MIFNLDNTDGFPDPRLGNKEGVYAIGGKLSPESLIAAYPLGIFPYFPFRNAMVTWWAPQERFVIFADEIKVSHSMRNLMNRNRFTCTINEDFQSVIAGCACVDGRIEENGAWLGPELVEIWCEINRRGHAKSVEVWDEDGMLIGGLYGFVSGGCFIGDSMFSFEPNASKLALIHLARHMQKAGGIFIDCQLKTEHLASMGGRFISYDEFLKATTLSPQIQWDNV